MPRTTLLVLLTVALTVAATAAVGAGLRRRAASPPARFSPGDRVRVAERGFWADGASGTIAAPPAPVAELAGDWRRHVRMVGTTTGVRPFYWVVLDEPRRDGDGDGPYREAEIAERSLTPLAPAPHP